MPPYTEPVPRSRLLLLAGAGVFGVFVFLIQLGVMVSVAQAGIAGMGLQSHLSGSADGLASGDYELGLAEFELAQESTDLLNASANSIPVRLLGAIPGLSTAVSNWQAGAEAADDIAQATGTLITLYGDLSGESGGAKIFSDGKVDLDRLKSIPDATTAVIEQLDAAELALESMALETSFSSILDRARDRALEEMKPVQTAVEALDRIAPVLPSALGADGPKRYLIAIGNQAEMRASGGAPLTLVMVEFSDGRISIPIKGQTSTQLFPPLNAPVQWFGPAPNPFFPGNPRNAPFVVTNTHPNYLYSAREMAGAWAGGEYPEVDGVVFMDLTAVSAVLRETGPIESAAYGTVDADRLGEILLIDAYQNFGQEDAVERQQANQLLLDELLTRLLGGDALISAVQAIAGTAPGRHFQMWMKEQRLEELALQAGFAGTVADPRTGDWSAVYTQNGNQSKVDVFQQRNVLVRVNLFEDGSARVSQQLTMTNATPPDRPEGPPERIGYETMWVKNAYVLYVPDRATELSSSYPDGFAVRPFKGHSRAQVGRGFVDDGFGHRMIRIVGWTPPGGQSAVSVSYVLPPGTFTAGETSDLVYRLQAEPQPLFINGTLTVQVTPPTGWRPVKQSGMKTEGGTATVSAVQNAPVNVQMEFERP